MLAMGFTMKNEFENKREIGFQWQGKKQWKLINLNQQAQNS